MEGRFRIEAALVANQHNAPRASPICFTVTLVPDATIKKKDGRGV